LNSIKEKVLKNIEDIWTRFVKEDLGIDTYDDRLHVEVSCVKSIIPKSDEEIALIYLTESHFDTRFDHIEKPEKVFLGGTCVGDDWRETLMPELKKRKIKYFNPVVKNWTPECQTKEEEEKLDSNTHLYIITPAMKGVYSIAEIIDSAYRHVQRGFCYVGIMSEGWDEGQKKSLDAVIGMVNNIGGSNIKASWINETLDILKLFPDDNK
jgi:hypothetical protein